MELLESIISGVVQGITEFLPISSSGHLAILHTFFGYKEFRVLEDAMLHLGTLVAVVIFFREQLISLCRDRKSLFLVIIATMPIVIVGVIFSEAIESFFMNTKAIGVAFIITGIWIFAAYMVSREPYTEQRNGHLGIFSALIIGIAQAVAVIPGISRIGATLSTGLLLKKDKEEIFSFSFILSIPAILGAVVYKSGNLAHISKMRFIYMVSGSVIACIVGIAALRFLKNVVLNNKLYYFSIYCWIIGSVAIIL